MTTDQANRLADILMGMDDAKKELVDEYVLQSRVKDRTSRQQQDMRDAGERWLENFDKLSEFLEVEFERTDPEVDLRKAYA